MSSELVHSIVRTAEAEVSGGFRASYLRSPEKVGPPLVAVSNLVPTSMIELLMRRKKDTAIGVKYVVGDEITNMEGAFHSLLVPVIDTVYIQGDYQYSGHHSVRPFDSPSGTQLSRKVIVSALVQPDFENTEVMFRLVKLEAQPVNGHLLKDDWVPLTKAEKQDPIRRQSYDESLKSHIVAAIYGKTLPPKKHVHAVTEDQVLEKIKAANVDDPLDLYCISHGEFLSIGLLYKIMVHQVNIELHALDDVAEIRGRGYIYTWDPPVIFARTIACDVLDELWLLCIANVMQRTGRWMKVLAFNDYRNSTIIARLRSLIHVPIVSKTSLFKGPKDTLQLPRNANLDLVVHNNSDAFGQNIEFESEYGSLDGAIGAASSAAASLLRSREDLLNYVKIYTL